MDLTTLSFIVIVLFFSLLSMLFISRFLPKGKSFEEMLKEKREMREKILGLTSPASSGAPTKSSKESANKRTKKTHPGGNANQNQKNRGAKQQHQQQQQHQRAEVVEPESDGHSSESPLEEEINPLTYGAKKRIGQTTNLTVEYAETEAFPLSENAAGNKKKDNKQQGGKKNKQKAAGGILVNKSEPVLVKSVETVPEMNHFAEIHPKDALEIARQQKHEDDTKVGKNQTPKEQRQQNKNKKDIQSKLSPKNNVPANVTEQQQQQHHQHHSANAAHVAEPKKQTNADNKSNAGSAHKDKSNKRKKNELITQELAVEMADAANVHSLVNILNKADLPRNDIQILIDFLLNKQQDTLAKDPSEWNDPSDPLQKLKKQLQEKESALVEEQKAAAGLHAKLKELRQELNGEKMQAGAVLKAYVEELNNKKQEVHNLTQELNSIKDKQANDKQAMSIQFQQLQAKYIQLSKEHASMQDHGATIAQLNNDLQLLQQELMAKSQLLNEKLQSEEEMMKKKTEFEILLHNNEELMRQRVQELTAYENDLRQLRLELTQKDELSYEIEQLKAELQAKQKQAVAAASAAAAAAHATSQADESNRVEIRNLQNALDSTKSKLEVYRNELVECKSLMTDYKQQTNELKAKEEQLQKQLEEQRQKNDEQQQKLINSSAEKVDVGKVVLEEQNRMKDLLVQLLQPTGVVVSALPVDATDFQSWLEATVGCIKEQYDSLQRSHPTNSTANDSSSTISSGVNNNAVVTNSHPEQSSGTANSNSDSSRLNSSSNIIANNNLNTNNNSVNSSLHENSNDGVVITNKNGATSDSGSEDDQQAMALRYEQMQQTVDQYKSIIADTENMLKNLEAKVIEQDIHWRTVVQAKDKELSLLKSAGAVEQ
ncbi:putative leucine-rich repeat-containing protein DDB_G0290503 isoform X2 [Anopheles funestus]|uniref:putative leucine-rich repeat-containing protein DDB_G0290503 isoform X2 n=1 Tax=Anopheles funestus TaxID=62324 RepID=UPI0020C5E5C6|nr:putative leucine-rich repeat-containing protein DDB_G0290503 isoform X2 [Anopheles funestus]